jgi:hypothetical protein
MLPRYFHYIEPTDPLNGVLDRFMHGKPLTEADRSFLKKHAAEKNPADDRIRTYPLDNELSFARRALRKRRFQAIRWAAFSSRRLPTLELQPCPVPMKKNHQKRALQAPPNRAAERSMSRIFEGKKRHRRHGKHKSG